MRCDAMQLNVCIYIYMVHVLLHAHCIEKIKTKCNITYTSQFALTNMVNVQEYHGKIQRVVWVNGVSS